MKGATIPRKLSVDYISFSAHVDYSQNSEFMELVKPQHIVSRLLLLRLDAELLTHLDRSWYTARRRVWAV